MRAVRGGTPAAAPPPARVRGNDWRAVDPGPSAPAAPGEGVSVVVPSFEAPGELERTLAALERQSLPVDRFEVIVVDDGSEPPVALPETTALDVRLVRQTRRGFGLARARNNGVRAARHDIVVFLDGDLVAQEDLLAAHARWHRAVGDALTLGFCGYADTRGLEAAALRNGAVPVAALFADRTVDPPWTERHMARTDDLTAPRDDLFRAVVGNNLGIRRALFEALGGFDESFDRYGWEDTEFGWRAQTAGALLVPARDAFAWHQGRFRANRHGAKRRDVAAQAPRGAARIPHPHFRRPGAVPGVPRTVVVVTPAAPGAAATVARLLAGGDADIAVQVVAGPGLDACALATLRTRFADDARVTVAPSCAGLAAAPGAPFLVELPAGADPGPCLVASLRRGLGSGAVGVATLPDGSRARILRASAVHRARRAGGRPADYGPVARFALGRAGEAAAVLGRCLSRALPAARRPLGGITRTVAEIARVRTRADAHRVARWLGSGGRWWLATRRGTNRAAARPARRVRVAVRPRQLLTLAVHRARGGAAADAAAAVRLVCGTRRRAGPYERLARRIRRGAARRFLGSTAALERLVRGLSERAPTATHAHAARAIAAALDAGDLEAVRAMARTAARRADLRAEKIVSRRHRFVWIANPKAGSRSLIAALLAADPDALLVREATLAEVYAAFPAARAYFSFAFVRHPVDRAVSCHGDKARGTGNVSLAAFAGLEAGMDLEAFCAWLATPWGSDAFADRHWLAQDVLLRERPGGRLPDFVGRFERLDADARAVAGGLGLRLPGLARLNPGPAARPPSAAARALLARRYARDLDVFGYGAGSAGSAGRCP